MSTGQIAEALQERGVTKDTKSPFGNIVSAVISHLRAKGEVGAVSEGLYELTSEGRAMWQHIKNSQKFKLSQSDAIEPTLLDGPPPVAVQG